MKNSGSAHEICKVMHHTNNFFKVHIFDNHIKKSFFFQDSILYVRSVLN